MKLHKPNPKVHWRSVDADPVAFCRLIMAFVVLMLGVPPSNFAAPPFWFVSGKVLPQGRPRGLAILGSQLVVFAGGFNIANPSPTLSCAGLIRTTGDCKTLPKRCGWYPVLVG